MNKNHKIVTQNLTQRFVDHRGIGLASKAVSELALHHRERGFDIGTLVIVGKKVCALELEVVIHLFPCPPSIAAMMRRKRDVRNGSHAGDRICIASTRFKLSLESAKSVGFIRDINGKKYVDLQGTQPAPAAAETEDTGGEELQEAPLSVVTKFPITLPGVLAPASIPVDPSRARKVYVTHGKNRALIEPIKELLKFGELEAVVSIQSPTVSQPVPTKVMSEMRTCGAALIHVEDERHLKDDDGKEVVVLNDNVLIEIGAAMALFGERFILVVKDGVKLPSNLQGLLVQPYKGTTLDMEETVKLMKAINDMKGRPLPS